MQNIKKQKYLIYLAIILPLFFGAVYFACASGLSAKMAPGTIFNPVCAPGESNCTVSQLAARGTSTGITAYNALTSANIGASNALEALGIGGGIKQSGAVNMTISSVHNQLLNDPDGMFVSGNYLYVVNSGSDSLLIYDNSDPVNPVRVGSLTDYTNMPWPSSVYVTSSYAYVVGSNNGNVGATFTIINVSNPANPVMVGKVTGDSNLTGAKYVMVKNNVAFITSDLYLNGGAHEQGSILAYDVSDPTNPKYISKVSSAIDGWIPDSFTVSGHYAYLVTYMPGEMTIIDIASTTNMQVKSTLPDPLGNDSGAVAARGNYVYFGHYWGGLYIVDVSSSTHPVVVGTLDNGSLYTTVDMVLSGNYVYMTSFYAPYGNYVTNFSVIDVSSTTNPVLVKQVNDTAAIGSPFNYSVAQSGNYIYVAGKKSNIAIFNISDQANPVQAGLIKGEDRLFSPARVSINNGYAYITNQGADGISVFDVHDPQQPKFLDTLSSYNYHNPWPYFMTGPDQIVIKGHYAYVVMEEGFRVVDISNPAKLTIVGSLDDADNLENSNTFGPLVIQGNYAYYVDFFQSLVEIVNIANPQKPFLVKSYNGITRPFSVAVSGKYAYITNLYGHIFTLDISNPATPSIANEFVDPAGLYSLSNIIIRGRYAYVTASATHSLTVFDISNPLAPVQVGKLVDANNLAYPYNGEEIDGNTLYILNITGAQITAVDISNPAAPKVVGGISDSSLVGVCDMKISGDYAYVLSAAGIFWTMKLHSSSLTGISAGNYTLGNLNLSGNANFSGSFSAKNYLNLAGSLSVIRSAVFGANILSINPNGNIGIGASGNSIFNIDNQAGKSALQIGGKYPACLKLKGASSWIYCTALNGVLSCGTNSCE